MKITITSPQNELVHLVAKLHNARTRHEMRRFLVEGKRACEPFFTSKFPLAFLFVTEEHEAWADAQNIAPEKIFLTTSRVIEKLSTATTPSGVLAVFDIPQDDRENIELGPGLVLANVQDPGNAGALIRTAVALDTTIVLVGGVDPFNQKIIQASAGALAHAKLLEMTWDELVAAAKKDGFALTALVVDGGADLRSLPTKTPRLLVVGNEAHGIPDQWLADCTERATLAMPGTTESLNAAVAGSIALYLTYPWN